MNPWTLWGGCVPQTRTVPVWIPKALRISQRARRLREAAVTGERVTRPARSRAPTSAPLGSSSKTSCEPAQAIGGEALDPVVAREAAGHDRGPDRRTLRRPQRGQRPVGSPPQGLGEGGQRAPGDPVAHLVRPDPVDADEHDPPRRLDALRGQRHGRRRRGPRRAQGQRHDHRGGGGQHHEGRGRRAPAQREEHASICTASSTSAEAVRDTAEAATARTSSAGIE